MGNFFGDPPQPSVRYPTILEGEILGPIRFENLTGKEFYLEPTSDIQVPGIEWNKEIHRHAKLKNVVPFYYQNDMWGITHLQKKSYTGWLRTDPSCYHSWVFDKLQETDEKGAYVPGTERGIYFRKPGVRIFSKIIIPSWRWQPSDKLKWQFTKGYLGRHWD